MGSKGSTSTQSVSIPPEVLAMYSSVNANAQQVAQTPFQTYSGEFVAPVNSEQQSGIAATNTAANQAQPYYSAATGALGSAAQAGTTANQQASNLYGAGLAAAAPATIASGAAANPTTLDQSAINQYLSPYLNDVVGSTASLLNQQNQQAMSGQTGNAISQGAFGGDRAGIAAAVLQGQQSLNEGNVLSNLLNTGYQSALGTAQQQQGVDLSAQQANLAREGSAAQQLYNEASGTASGLAGVGNQQYTQGANTANELGALGTGAQAAGLQGAQAQLAAGQVEQQTQQAQDTAQYNQFLQQQSYPFQTAQFLANIAEGTGSLSGSTTTTTQPGGFFSDKRLKEDIEPIGETYDGQKIYKYRYKDGDKRKQIGLMAQDVEKKHPHAVGLAGGYRTVDYDKATEGAAERGHFYKGGLVPANSNDEERRAYANGGYSAFSGLGPSGVSPIDIAALLSAQEQMYAPFAQAGLYGGQAGGAPHGGSSYVPAANLPVSHLQVAGPLPKQDSELEQAGQIAGLAVDVSKGTDWIKKQLASDDSDISAPSADMSGVAAADQADTDNYWDQNQNAPNLKRGGLARAKRADGGANDDLPYGQQGGLNIPDDDPQAKLATASGNVSKPQSGLSQLSGLAGTVSGLASAGSSIMDLLPLLALKHGGVASRKGYADGSSVDDDGNGIVNMDMEDPNSSWARSLGDSVRDAEAQRAQVRSAIGNAASDFWSGLTGKTAPKSSASPTVLDVPVNTVTPTPRPNIPIAARGLSAASRQPNITAPSADLGGLAASDNISDSDAIAAQMPGVYAEMNQNNQPAPQAGGLASVSVPPATDTSAGPGWFDKATADGKVGANGKEIPNSGGWLNNLLETQNIIPLLAGIGAMGSAKTVHPGVALAQGLEAGALAYPKVQSQQAELAQTQAATGNIGANATKQLQANAITFRRLMQAGLIKRDPAGTIVDPETGIHYSNTQSGTSVPGSESKLPYKYLGPSAQALLPNSAEQFLNDSPGIGITPNGGNIRLSNKIIADTQQAAADAQTAKTIQNEQAAALLSPDRKGILSQGALAPVFQPYVEKFNSLVTDSGHPEWAISGLGDAQIAHKLQLGQAAMQSTGAGQHAYQALSDFTQLAPGGSLDPHAAATLMAQNAVAATKAIDQRNALDEAKQHAPNGNYEAQDIMTAFDRDNPPAVYNAMRDAVTSIYQNPAYATIHSALAKPGTPEYRKTINTLNAYGTQRGIPNFARVFTGG